MVKYDQEEDGLEDVIAESSPPNHYEPPEQSLKASALEKTQEEGYVKQAL